MAELAQEAAAKEATEEAAEEVINNVAEEVTEDASHEGQVAHGDAAAEEVEDEDKDTTFVLSDDEFEQLQSRDQFVTMTRRKKRMKIGRERRRYDLFCDDDYVVHVKKNH